MKKSLFGFLLISFLWMQVQDVTFASPHISQRTTQLATPIAVLDRLFTESSPEAELFDPLFLQQIPLTDLEKILIQIRQTLGDYQSIQKTENGYLIVFEQGSVPTQISLNEKGQIIYLFFQPPVGNTLSWTEILQQLQELPGEIVFLVTKDGEAIAQLNSDRPLAVGSAFKLAVLAALQKEIVGGNLAWDNVVKLKSQWQSLPSGMLVE